MFLITFYTKYYGAKHMNTRKAISPILATVIIIAVTLVIAIGVIGWIMGIWGSFGSTESLQIYPDSYIVNSTGGGKVILSLHIKNTGTATANIEKVEVLGIGTNSSVGISIKPGDYNWYNVTISSPSDYPTPGTSYQVKIYTAAGNVYSAVVQAKS